MMSLKVRRRASVSNTVEKMGLKCNKLGAVTSGGALAVSGKPKGMSTKNSP